LYNAEAVLGCSGTTSLYTRNPGKWDTAETVVKEPLEELAMFNGLAPSPAPTPGPTSVYFMNADFENGMKSGGLSWSKTGSIGDPLLQYGESYYKNDNEGGGGTRFLGTGYKRKDDGTLTHFQKGLQGTIKSSSFTLGPGDITFDIAGGGDGYIAVCGEDGDCKADFYPDSGSHSLKRKTISKAALESLALKKVHFEIKDEKENSHIEVDNIMFPMIGGVAEGGCFAGYSSCSENCCDVEENCLCDDSCDLAGAPFATKGCSYDPSVVYSEGQKTEIDHMVDVWVPKLVNSIEAQRLGAAENLASEVKDAKSELDFIAGELTQSSGVVNAASIMSPLSDALDEMNRTVQGYANSINNVVGVTKDRVTNQIDALSDAVERAEEAVKQPADNLRLDMGQDIGTAESTASSDKKIAEGVMGTVQKKTEDTRESITSAFDELMKTHTNRYAGVERVRDETLQLLKKMNGVLESIPDIAQEAIDKTASELKQEGDARQQAQARLESNLARMLKVIQDLGGELRETISEVLRGLDKSAHQILRGNEKDLKDDATAYDAEMLTGMNELKKVTKMQTDDLTSRLDKADAKIRQVQQDLAKHKANEQAMPMTVDAKVAELQEFTTKAFQALRTYRDTTLTTLGKTFGDDVDNEVLNVIKTLSATKAQLVMDAEKNVLASTERAEQLIDPAVRDVEDLETKMKEDQREIKTVDQERNSNLLRMNRINQYGNKQVAVVTKRLNRGDDTLKQKMDKFVSKTRTDAKYQDKELLRALDAANKSIDRASDRIWSTFDQELATSNASIESQIGGAVEEKEKLEQLSTSVMQGLLEKLSEVGGRVRDVNQTLIPTLEHAVVDFMQHAEREVLEVPDDLAKVSAKTRELAAQHTEALNATAEKVLLGLQEELRKASGTVDARISRIGTKADERVTEVNETNTDLVNEQEHLLGNLEEIRDANKGRLDTADQDLPDAAGEAQDKVDQAEQKLGALLVKQQADIAKFQRTPWTVRACSSTRSPRR
jgi:hypothetical protein